MKRIAIKDMSFNQLKLEYVAACATRKKDAGCFAYTSMVDEDVLRKAMLSYETALAVEDWHRVDDALLLVHKMAERTRTK